MSDQMELIGDDGTLEAVTLGAAVVGDAIKTLDVLAGGVAGSKKGKGYWMITAKAVAASIFAGLELGELFPAEGDEVPATGDKCMFATAVVLADYVSWNMKVSASKVDVTRGIHKFKKSRTGKLDASGTIKGIFTTGITDQAGGFLNRYFKIITKKADGSLVIAPRSNQPIYIRGVVRNSALPGETFEFMWARIDTDGFNVGAESGNAQSFETGFSLVGNDPVFYVEEIPAA